MSSHLATHAAHFFHSAEDGDAAVAEFVADGVARGEDVLVVATDARAAVVRARLGASADAANVTFVDARQAVDAIMVDAALDHRKLTELLLPFVKQSDRPKRIYGEMVALLTADGQLEAALGVERAGEELAHDLGVRILCGYDHHAARRAAPDALARISDRHDVTHFDQPPIGTVLLADDYEDTRDLFGEYLSFKGYQVVLACDGVEALEQARRFSPDVMLLDVRMPKMTGTEAMQAIKTDPQFTGVPVVALTAHALDYERDALLTAGFDAVVTKPCLPDALADIVFNLVKGRAAV